MLPRLDVTHHNGAWVPTAEAKSATPTGAPIGSAAAADARLTEGAEARTASLLWSVVMGAIFVMCIAGALFGEGLQRVIPAIVSLAPGALFVLALLTWRSSRTREVRWDEHGVADHDVLRIRRVPWSAIRRWERVNTAQGRQAAHDRIARHPDRANPVGRRPQDVWVWIASDAQGERLFEWMDASTSAPAFEHLRRRIEQHALRPRAR